MKTEGGIIITFVVFMLGLFYLTYTMHEDKKQTIIKVAEEAYFEGQKDAINGDIRVEKVKDSTYRWCKSPWDSGRKPLFNPF